MISTECKALQLSIFHITEEDNDILYDLYDKDEYPHSAITGTGFIIKPFELLDEPTVEKLTKLKFSTNFISIYLKAIASQIIFLEFDSNNPVDQNLEVFEWIA